MAISKCRIKSEKLIESSKAGACGNMSGQTTPSSVSDLEPKGLTDLLPPSFTQFSNFKDLMNMAAKDVKSIYKDLDNALKIPSLGDFDLQLANKAGGMNFNANPINQTLGIFHAILCGDSDGLDLNARALIDALAYGFGFLNWNVCGRQRLRNPVDVLINSANNLRRDYNALINLGPRIMRNLQTGVNGFIRRLNLPKNLEDCMLDNALSNMVIKNKTGIPPGAIRNLRKALNPDICKKSKEGVPGYNRTLEKVKVTPLITGLASYDEATMYAFHGAILNSGEVSNDIIMEVLSESIQDKDSTNLFKTLELIALTKLTEVIDDSVWNSDVQNLNNSLHKANNPGELILENVLKKAEQQTTANPVDMMKVKRDNSVDMTMSLDVNGKNVLKHMKDDLVTSTTNPEKKFYNTVKLIEIADPRFKPKESVIDMSECEPLSALAIAGGEGSTYKSTKQSNETDIVTEDGVQYMKVYNDISLMDQVIGCSGW